MARVPGCRVRMVSEADIDRYARVLADAASSRARVTVFGSYARGTASTASDLDVLVIEEHVDSRAAESCACVKHYRSSTSPSTYS